MNHPNKTDGQDGDCYFSGKSADGTMIYVGPVTREQVREAEIQGGSSGYFLCEFDPEEPVAGVSVLAVFATPEAAYRLAEILGLYRIDQPLHEFEEPLDLEM